MYVASKLHKKQLIQHAYLLYSVKTFRHSNQLIEKLIFYSNTIALKHITPVNAALQIMRKHYNKHAEFTRYWKEVQLTLSDRNRGNAKQWRNITNLMKAYESATADKLTKSPPGNKGLEENGMMRTRFQLCKSVKNRSVPTQPITPTAEPIKPKKSRSQTSVSSKLKESSPDNKVLEKNGVKRTRSQLIKSDDNRFKSKPSKLSSGVEQNKPKKSRLQANVSNESMEQFVSHEPRSTRSMNSYNLRKKM